MIQLNGRKAIFMITACLTTMALLAQNPIIQTSYTADPAPMVHNGTVYVYTSPNE